MTDIKPIETIYNGYRFRSRLEARWAVFFDSLGVDYEYEPEGFSNNGVLYLPDFLIHGVEAIHCMEWTQDVYVEVEGVPDQASADKVFTFSRGSRQRASGNPDSIPIWVVGNIPDPDDYINSMEEQRSQRCEKTRCIKNHCSLCINDFGPLDGDMCFSFSLDYTDHLIFRGADSSYDYGKWSDEIQKAFRKARQARFEHGETPNIRR